MASIDFYSPNGDILISSSGLGFYGNNIFGDSVAVGAYQGLTYVTNSGGITTGPQANNIKWTHANSGSINGAPNINLLNIPAYQSTLNMRFTHGSAVTIQNARFRICSREDINAGASGVTVQAAEVIHADPSQAVVGSGDSAWIQPSGSGLQLVLVDSPGLSGSYGVSGSVQAFTRHDWYVNLSVSPNSVGSKYFLAYGSCEYY